MRTSSTQKKWDFEEHYRRVPPEQVAQLKDFRASHPYKRTISGGTEWEYIACGKGEGTILLLPGALSVGESMFPLIRAFEKEYRVIAPSYALAHRIDGLCDGIAQILDIENVDQANVFGGSYGGLVAQYFVRRYPSKVRSLILAHTFVFNPKYVTLIWLMGKLMRVVPSSWMTVVLRLRLEKIIFAKLRAVDHPEKEFWRAYLKEALASDLLKNVFKHQTECLLDLAQQPRLTADDLHDWPGTILIIESEDDPAIGPKDRELLRKTYPHAQLHTFTDAGHVSSIVKRVELVSLIERFVCATYLEG